MGSNPLQISNAVNDGSLLMPKIPIDPVTYPPGTVMPPLALGRTRLMTDFHYLPMIDQWLIETLPDGNCYPPEMFEDIYSYLPPCPEPPHFPNVTSAMRDSYYAFEKERGYSLIIHNEKMLFIASFDRENAWYLVVLGKRFMYRSTDNNPRKFTPKEFEQEIGKLPPIPYGYQENSDAVRQWTAHRKPKSKDFWDL